MTEPKTKREKIAAIEELAESWAWTNVVLPEIQRLRAEADAQSSDLEKSHSVRDGGAGAKNALDKVIAYPSAYQRAQEAALDKEKRASLTKRPPKPLR